MHLMQARLRSTQQQEHYHSGQLGLPIPYGQHQQLQMYEPTAEQQQLGWEQQRRRQRQQQQMEAVAEAFPEIDADWEGGPGPGGMPPGSGAETEAGGTFAEAQRQQAQHPMYQGQRYRQYSGLASQLPSSPPPGLLGRAGGALHQGAMAWGPASLPHQEEAWQQGARGRDEFGVSVQPSLSDDGSDVAGPAPGGQNQPAADQPPSGMHHMLAQDLLLPAACLVAAGTPARHGGGSADSQTEAFLSSHKRDFSVPRMGKTGVTSRQLLPTQPARGAGVVAAHTAE